MPFLSGSPRGGPQGGPGAGGPELTATTVMWVVLPLLLLLLLLVSALLYTSHRRRWLPLQCKVCTADAGKHTHTYTRVM